MDLKLEGKQIQTLSPRIIQSMQILQMDALELGQFLTQQIQDNPVLEMTEPPRISGGSAASELGRELRYSREEDDGREPGSGEPPLEETLPFHLISQLPGLSLTRRQEKACQIIIASLDHAGYLDESPEALAARCSFSPQELETALATVQRLDPPGVGAGNVHECLRLQLERMECDTRLAQRIVDSGLDALAKCRYPQLAKQLGARQKDVIAACDLIRSLNPKPGAAFGSREIPAYITPDLIVELTDGIPQLTLNDAHHPSVTISSYYSRLLKETEEAEVRTYLEEKIRQADWVIKCIDQRRSTLLRCAQMILQRQQVFFAEPDGHLVPMRMSDLAREMEVHESTVSRALRGKYLQCSRGIFPLSSFFSAGLAGSRQDGGVCAGTAKAMLRTLVEKEDPAKPLSDQKLCDLLETAGCILSRRTVAKYREQLGILPAAARKR